MWQSRAGESQDALHASRVLQAILKKGSNPPANGGGGGGSQCPLSQGLGGNGPFEGGSRFCTNREECERVPAITQLSADQTVNFDELPALDRFFTSETMLDWSRANCPLLFTDAGEQQQ